MSTRFIVAAVAGVVVGYFSGNPQAGFQTFALVYGVSAGLDPNKQVTGPKLNDLKGPSASEGAPIPYIKGVWRTAGNIIWNSNKQEVANTETQGGKGGPGVDSTTFTYKIDVLYEFSINELAAIRRVWSNGKLVYSLASDDQDSIDASNTTDSWEEIRFYSGALDQMPDPDYEAAVGVGNAPAYRGRATCFIKGLNLGGSGQLPVLNFEVLSKAESAVIDPLVKLQVDFQDGTATDLSAYENTPTAEGDMLVLEADGNWTANLGTVDPTLSGWLYWSGDGMISDAGDRTFQCRYTDLRPELGSDVAQTIFQYRYGNAGSQIIHVFVGGGLPNRSLFVRDLNPVALIETTLPPGGNVHVCVMTDAATQKLHLYLNGILIGSPNHSIPATGSNPPSLAIGAYPNNSVGTTKAGRWDNIRVYAGHEFDLAGFTPPATLPPVDGAGQVVTPQAEDLADVVAELCSTTGLLEDEDIDVSDLVGTEIRGFAQSSGTNRQAIEILMSAYLFESVESDTLKFVKRGGAPALTIPFVDLGATTGEPAEPLPLTRNNDLELPARVTVKYSNALNDYQDGLASGDRLVTNSTSTATVELPVVLSPLEAAKIADVQTMDLQISLISIGPFSLACAYAALEPTDVVIVEGRDGSHYRGRVMKVTDSEQVRKFEVVLDDADVLDSQADADNTDNSTVLVRAVSDTDALLIDGPIARDIDDDQGFYLLAKPTDPAKLWPAGVIFASRDGTSYDRVDAVTERAIFGACVNTLGDWTGPRVFDEFNEIVVGLDPGVTLSSTTRDAMLDDQTINAFAIGSPETGWEYGQFRTAVLDSDGFYVLSGLLRGSRGTEWRMVGHEAGETFALLRPAGTRRVLVDTSAIGQERFYKVPTSGKSLSSATAIPFTDNAVGLKPFSPFDARKALVGSDIVITWQRRTRLAVRTIGPSGISIPLGEEIEAYSIDILPTDSSTGVRTLTSSTTSVTYTAAMQAADGYGGGPLAVTIYQLSTVVGRGYPLEATL